MMPLDICSQRLVNQHLARQKLERSRSFSSCRRDSRLPTLC